MERSEDQNLALVRELLITEPYRFKARSRTTESENVWQQIADNLNSDHTLKFPSKKFFFFSNKRSLRHQSSKTSRVFLKDVMELKQESITLSSLVRQAASPNLLNLKVAASWLQAFSVPFTATSRVS